MSQSYFRLIYLFFLYLKGLPFCLYVQLEHALCPGKIRREHWISWHLSDRWVSQVGAGNWTRFSGRTSSVLDHWAIFPALQGRILHTLIAPCPFLPQTLQPPICVQFYDFAPAGTLWVEPNSVCYCDKQFGLLWNWFPSLSIMPHVSFMLWHKTELGESSRLTNKEQNMPSIYFPSFRKQRPSLGYTLWHQIQSSFLPLLHPLGFSSHTRKRLLKCPTLIMRVASHQQGGRKDGWTCLSFNDTLYCCLID